MDQVVLAAFCLNGTAATSEINEMAALSGANPGWKEACHELH